MSTPKGDRPVALQNGGSAMTSTRVFVVAAILLTASTAAAETPAPMEIKRLPRVLPTADEIANPDLYHPRVPFEYVPPPEVYGPPPPAGSVRPGEFDPMDSVVITVINQGPAFMDMWVEMLEVYSQAGHTWIIASEPTQEAFGQMLEDAGVPGSAYSWLNYPVNSIWIRDYGPEFTVAPDGARYVLDTQYHTDRPLDDVIPQLIAASDWIGSDGQPLDINQSDHMLSGGNVMSDGAGTCFFSHIVYGYEQPSSWSDEDVDQHMAEYLGCEQMIVLNPICLDGTGHIDLYSKLLSPTSILLGEYPPDTHFDGETYSADSGYCADNYPNDYQDQEDNLAIIEASTNLDSEPWVVTRIPMPEPFLDEGYWTYRSYLNSQIFNNYVAMPSYYAEDGPETAEELLDLEAEAIAAYETALPGVDVTPIDSDHIIWMAGAIHCITHEIPQEDGGAWEPPTEYCGDGVVNGDEECDGGDFGGQSCTDFTDGLGDYLRCTADCTIDASECPPAECGDGLVNGDEDCDPCAPEQSSCEEYGLGEGAAGCNLDCTVNVYDCVEGDTPCELLAATKPGVVCCPDPPPGDCDDGSWDWSNHDSYYGCCTQDLVNVVWCGDGQLADYSCEPDICTLIGSSYMDCGAGTMPQQTDPDLELDCPDLPDENQDAGPDAGPGGKDDDGCGCRAAGQGGLRGLLAVVLALLLG